MAGLHLYLVTPEGPRRLPLQPSEENKSVHTILDDLPLGVYTSFRTFAHDKFLCLSAHLDRLEESMALLSWTFQLDKRALIKALHQVCQSYPYPDARVRIDVLASAPARWGLATEGDNARVFLALSPFEPVPEQCYRRGVATAIANSLNRGIPQAKQADFVLARRAHAGADRRYFEYLLADGNGLILEGTSSNFYAVCDGVVWTAGEGILEGTARRIVLTVAASLGIEVKKKAWPLEKLNLLNEAFLSSSSRGIVPIVSINDQPIGNGRPGPVTRNLMAAYDAYVRRNIQPATALPAP